MKDEKRPVEQYSVACKLFVENALGREMSDEEFMSDENQFRMYQIHMINKALKLEQKTHDVAHFIAVVVVAIFLRMVLMRFGW